MSLNKIVLDFRKTEVQEELQDFRETSQEIEKELETELEQNEKDISEIRAQNTALTFEYEALKVL